MRLGSRLLSVALLAFVVAPLAAAPLVGPVAPAPAVEPGLSEFRTVENARTTRISRAAPPVERTPAYLGVHLDPSARGKALVAAVEPGSPAALAGVQAGDVVRQVDGQPITGPSSLRELLQEKGAGEALRMVVLRKGKTVAASATLVATSRPMKAGQRAVLGVVLQPAGDKGVRIENVTPRSPAAAAKLKAGDVITRVDGKAVADLDRIRAILSGKHPGDPVTLAVRRDGKDMEVKAKLAADRTFDRRRSPRWDSRMLTYFRKPVYRLAVVPVEYPDVKHNPKVGRKDWDKALFSRQVYGDKSPTGERVYGSLRDYYEELSCGALEVQGKVFDYVKVSRKRTQYAEGNRFALLNEALDKLLERDGKDALKGFDGLFFLYSGGNVRTVRGGLYWPHRASMRYKGKGWAYFICPEGGGHMASISVIAHEFGHMLGLPDLYSQQGRPEGLGVWCTMAVGHGRDGKPLHFSAWCKEQLGWIEPAVIDPTVPQKLILRPVENRTRECFKVLVRPDGSEYLLLENRVRKGFDRDLPGEGLLIWRVLDGKVTLEESHGITTPDGPDRFLGSVPYPSKSNNAFTPGTTPSSKSPRGGGWPVHITNIRRLPDGRVTFFIGYEYL